MWEWDITFLGPKTWNILPDKLKNITNLEVLKSAIKSLKPGKGPSRLSRIYKVYEHQFE